MAHPIIPWPGGKRRLLTQLLPLFDGIEHRCYVEAFAGGAALLFARPPAPVEVLNDINGELVRLYRCVQHHLDELVRQFRWALTSREMFAGRSCSTSSRSPTSSAPRVSSTCRSSRSAARWPARASATARRRRQVEPAAHRGGLEPSASAARGVTIENSSWQELVRRYDRAETAFYFDPPYWQTSGYGNQFGFEQYEQLALCNGVDGRKGGLEHQRPQRHSAAVRSVPGQTAALGLHDLRRSQAQACRRIDLLQLVRARTIYFRGSGILFRGVKIQNEAVIKQFGPQLSRRASRARARHRIRRRQSSAHRLAVRMSA
jgi:DNA adenine methylase